MSGPHTLSPGDLGVVTFGFECTDQAGGQELIPLTAASPGTPVGLSKEDVPEGTQKASNATKLILEDLKARQPIIVTPSLHPPPSDQ